MGADYDGLAWFYERYWRTRFHDAARPVLGKLLYDTLPAASRVLDLCCGTGHLTRELLSHGYAVVGLDRSIEMLRFAQRTAPDAMLVCADARRFAVARCDAVVATFDSVNHLLTAADLAGAFGCAAEALVPGGALVFDVNTAEAYASEWGKSSTVVEDDAALFVRGTYDPATRLGTTKITGFRRDTAWRRADVEILQRCYEPEEISSALAAAGFASVESHAAAAVGMVGDIAVGRRFYRAVRNGSG
jgi:SAM-dependent methyltransferase